MTEGRAGDARRRTLDARVTANGVDIPVHVVPRASRTAMAGIVAGSLRVRVAAPPVEGAANSALISFLAAALRVPRRDVSLTSGQASRRKWVRVAGLDVNQIQERLGL